MFMDCLFTIVKHRQILVGCALGFPHYTDKVGTCKGCSAVAPFEMLTSVFFKEKVELEPERWRVAQICGLRMIQ